jgi:hypothetical protein
MRHTIVSLLTCCLVALATSAGAATVEGIEGPVFGAAVVSKGLEASGQKPESKLFFTEDGRWWGALGLADGVATPGVYLFELTGSGWLPRVRLADSDPWAKADTLYDATADTLLVSLRDNKVSDGANARRSTLHTLAYDGLGGWTEPGSPLTITTANVETITIAKDSLGRVWASFEQAKRIKAGYLLPGATGFTFMPVSSTNVAADDIATVVAFDGKIGVFWSDQIARRFMFAVRDDTAALRKTKFTREVAYGEGVGGCPTATSDRCADDHVNLTVANGEALAVVKTSLNDEIPSDPDDPLIVLLTRSGGEWSPDEVSDVEENFTRPIVLADPSGDRVFVFASVLNGDTYAWDAELSDPDFDDEQPWTVDTDLVLSNPTSTKQAVSADTGYVVMTSTPKAPYRYWYNLVEPA